MITKTEAVWRHLLAEADSGRRRFRTITELAQDLGMGVSTVHKSLQRPAEIGAIQVRGAGGIRVLDPWRLLMLWAGKRDWRRDVLATYHVDMLAPEAERKLAGRRVILGGFGAVVARRGANLIADYDRVLCYGSPDDIQVGLRGVAGVTEIIVLQPDPLLKRYGHVTTLSQAYVDLFNTPGWQAERFVHQLSDETSALAA